MHKCYDDSVQIERPPQPPHPRLQLAFIDIGHEASEMFEFRRKMLTIFFHNRAIDKVTKYLLELQQSY